MLHVGALVAIANIALSSTKTLLGEGNTETEEDLNTRIKLLQVMLVFSH